jgi:flagella basal body P-ring formation protein FlgA
MAGILGRRRARRGAEQRAGLAPIRRAAAIRRDLQCQAVDKPLPRTSLPAGAQAHARRSVGPQDRMHRRADARPLARRWSGAPALMRRRIAVAALLLVPWLAAAAQQAAAQAGDTAFDAATLDGLRAIGEAAGAALAGVQARVEVEPGRLDPRLKLAPCNRVEARLPPGAAAWGRTRVALRCADGPTAWQVYLPVTVHVWATAWVAAMPLPAGTVLQPEHVQPAEVDWAAERSAPVTGLELLVGRALQRPLQPAQPVRGTDLAQRQWFAAGDKVQVVARGAGYAVSGEAQALGPGIEGRPVRVRTESGQVLTGQPVGTRRVELAL